MSIKKNILWRGGLKILFTFLVMQIGKEPRFNNQQVTIFEQRYNMWILTTYQKTTNMIHDL